MPILTDQVAKYAAYHRDRRNIATHFVGVPMIVLAVAILLSRPTFEVAGLALSPAWLLVAATCAFYFSMSLGYGLVMTVLLALITWAAGHVAAGSTALSLGAGIGLFVVGWAIQFIGHYYEGRKPAFVDDVVGLLIGPLFLAVEAAFAIGASAELRRAIEARVGPTHDGKTRRATA
jgi:uncharacterized membrane protein YGL010W